jgi:hypothetical protein
VAEAFYFLGKIHYERAMLDIGYSTLDTGREEQKSSIQYPASSIENIAWAKKYLRKAEEYGIVYDRLHPDLLDEINRKYPKVDTPISRSSHDKTRIMIQIENGLYQLDAVKIDEHMDITQSEFLTNEEFSLECGARYKVEPDIQGGRRAIYRALTILGVGLAIWFTRG